MTNRLQHPGGTPPADPTAAADRQRNTAGAPRTADRPPIEDPHAALERALIDEFLRIRGHTLRSMASLPPEEMATLLRAAVAHATLRLSEIQARAHYVAELHP